MANEAIDGRFGQRCGLSDMLIVGVSLQKRNETRVPIGGLRRSLEEPALLGVSSPRRMRSSDCNLKSSLRLPHYHTGRLAVQLPWVGPTSDKLASNPFCWACRQMSP